MLKITRNQTLRLKIHLMKKIIQKNLKNNLNQKNSNQVIYFLSYSKDDNVSDYLFPIFFQFLYIIIEFNNQLLLYFSNQIIYSQNLYLEKIEHMTDSFYGSSQGFKKQFPLSSSPNTSSPMQKISNFLQMKNISIHDFWITNRNYASSQDIISFCSSCGLKIGIHDQINMKAQIFSQKEIISIYQFCELIPFWKEKGKQMVSDFLKKRSQMLIQQLQSKQKKRPKSSNFVRSKTSTMFNNSNGLNANQTKYGRQNSLSKLGANKNSQEGFGFNLNNSLKYLQKHKQKQHLLEKQLAETIDKTKNEYEYGMLLKMSQMNENNRQKNKNQTYRAYKSAEGIIRVRVFELNRFVKQINLKEFDRIYKSFKKNTKQKKEWALPTMNEEEQQKENKAVHSLKMKNARKADRQQQLKNLLVNTVNLTNLLKEQIKIFKKKGIYGCQDI